MGGLARQRKRQPRSGHADPKTIDIDTEFVGGQAPEGFVPVDGFQRDGGSIVLSEDGKVYQRDFSFYNDYPVAHSGKYGTTPVYFDGGMEIALMNGFDHFTNKSYGHIPYALLYDRLNNRLLSVYGFNVRGNTSSRFRRVPRVESARRCVREARGYPIRESGLVFPDVADLGDYTVQAMGAASPMLRSALPPPRPITCCSVRKRTVNITCCRSITR